MQTSLPYFFETRFIRTAISPAVRFKEMQSWRKESLFGGGSTRGEEDNFSFFFFLFLDLNI
jgi:hypothetical protein